MNADDHALLEQTRNANKTLSLFAFALQQECEISTENHDAIVNQLGALVEAVRERGVRQATGASAGSLVIEGESESRTLDAGTSTDEQRP